MNKSLIIVLSILSVIIMISASLGCKDKRDGEHCFNGFLDEDETGIDCGGAECESCIPKTCFTPDSTMIVDGTEFNISSANGWVDWKDFNLTIGAFGAGSLLIEFDYNAPAGTEFAVSDFIGPGVGVRLTQSYTYYSTGQGKIYITQGPNGKVYELCDVKVTGIAGTEQETKYVNAKIECDNCD